MPRNYPNRTPDGVKPKRQPMVLTCAKCPATIAVNVDPVLTSDWPQHKCRATDRPAPFSKAKPDTENRHMPVWKL